MKCITCLEYCTNQNGNIFSCENKCLIITKRKDLIIEYDILFKYKNKVYRLYLDSYINQTTLYRSKYIFSIEDSIPVYDFRDYDMILEINSFFEIDGFDENFIFSLVDKLLLLKTFS
jgi:hypothetical protein